MLLDEIDSRFAAGQPAILKSEAEAFLMEARYTRVDARTIIDDRRIFAVQVMGKGNPVELHSSMKVEAAAEMRESSDPSKDSDFIEGDFRRPHLERTAEIDPSRTRINTSDFEPAISAVEISHTDEMPPPAEPGTASGEGLFFDLEA